MTLRSAESLTPASSRAPPPRERFPRRAPPPPSRGSDLGRQIGGERPWL